MLWPFVEWEGERCRMMDGWLLFFFCCTCSESSHALVLWRIWRILVEDGVVGGYGKGDGMCLFGMRAFGFSMVNHMTFNRWSYPSKWGFVEIRPLFDCRERMRVALIPLAAYGLVGEEVEMNSNVKIWCSKYCIHSGRLRLLRTLLWFAFVSRYSFVPKF